ncbi:MAG TPA: PDZ domain-containing protein [Thermoanaerobaculaceae bacterium]|nr:PDZ domain-containing protein [Thermoanaerobaculaceae bacterium]
MARRLVVPTLLVMAVVATVAGAAAPTLFRTPAVNRTHVVFAYAGDLWSVPREGGDAVRLTSGVGIESDPVFSPDGSQLAFAGQYDGNTDVYVMPAAGGEPRRLTYHPDADTPVSWTNDGKAVLFASARASHARFPRLFTIGLAGGLPEPLPLPMGERGSYSPDGQSLAYEPLAQWQPAWKRYRGGQTDAIWLARLSDSSVEEIPRPNSNDRYPMWIGDRVFFVSDRDGAATLYAFDTTTRKISRVLDNSGLDVRSASSWRGDGAERAVIAYEQFGTLHLYDVASGRTRPVAVRVTADLVTVRPRFEKVGDQIANAAVSPNGVRAVFEARGEILIVPADKGDTRNLTATPGVMERDPAWSPDGTRIAYFSDASGEYALHIRDQKGEQPAQVVTLPAGFYYSPVWSPDSTQIAFSDNAMRLWLAAVGKGEPKQVDTNPFGLRDDVLQPAWSPDSKWLAYSKQLDNRLRAVFLYSLEKGETHQVTDGMADARYPVFDRGGKLLFFAASTNLGPSFSFAELSGYGHLSSRSVYALVLAKDTPSPLAPESDEEKGPEKKAEEADKAKGTPEKGTKAKPDEKKGGGMKAESPEPVKVDLEDLVQRSVALPIPSRDYVGLDVGKAGKLYVIERPVTGLGEEPGPPSLVVHRYDLDKRKLGEAISGVRAFVVAASGEKALYRKGDDWFIKSLDALTGGEGGPLATAAMQVRVDPPAEWRQMFDEVWRGERDFFYDANLHGLDLEKAKATYRPYLAAVAHRSDLTYLFTEMLNQLTVGHMYIGGGDMPKAGTVPGGLLGCDFSIENGRYRFATVLAGESWNPDLRAPLVQPGAGVEAGEYLLAVGSRDLTSADNVYARFENTADRQVALRVGPNPDGSGARDVTVVPVRSEASLRNLSWIEGNRRKVEALSAGRLAYIYVPDTSGRGFASFNRYFFAQTEKQGAVVDERFNGGGLLADYIVDYLRRPLLSYMHFRHGRDVPTPMGGIWGPKAMLINELAGSGGDALPWYFHKLGIGPLVGKRTWGGLIAAFTAPQLMDGGYVTAPDAAVYGLAGQWEVENVGVGPDIEVSLDPKAWRQGHDAQLERAVEWLLAEIAKNPQRPPKRPDFPRYH